MSQDLFHNFQLHPESLQAGRACTPKIMQAPLVNAGERVKPRLELAEARRESLASMLSRKQERTVETGQLPRRYRSPFLEAARHEQQPLSPLPRDRPEPLLQVEFRPAAPATSLRRWPVSISNWTIRPKGQPIFRLPSILRRVPDRSEHDHGRLPGAAVGSPRLGRFRCSPAQLPIATVFASHRATDLP